MIIRNNSSNFKKMNGQLVRPWRSVEVSDGYVDVPDMNVIEKDLVKKNIDEMNKDELLDYTAVHNIEADYNMSKRKLKKLIKQSEEN